MRIQALFKSEAPLLGGRLPGQARWSASVTLVGADVCYKPSATNELVLSVQVDAVEVATLTLLKSGFAEVRMSPAFNVVVPPNGVVTIEAATYEGAPETAPAMVSVNLRGTT